MVTSLDSGAVTHASRTGAIVPAPPERTLLASRLRSGSWIVLAGSLAFLIADLVRGEGPVLALVALKLLQGAILAAVIVATTRIDDRQMLRWIGALAVSAVYSTSVASGVLREAMLATDLLFIATCMATATFVPWGGRAQLATVIGAALALGVARVLSPAAMQPITPYLWLTTLIALSGSVWIAYEHDRQRRERQHAERLLAAESRVSAALARVGEEMIRSDSTPSVLDGLCALVAELLSCEQTALVLYDAGENAFTVHSSFGHRPEEWETLRAMRVPARLVKRLLQAFATEGLMDLETTSIRQPDLRAMHQRMRIARSLYVPLRSGGELIGIISAHYRDARRHFSDTQKRIAIGAAHLTSLALQNARLFEELREANRLKSDFVSTMSHELRTPVSVILGYVDMLAEEPDRDERNAMLERIRRSGIELLELVEETLNLSRLEAGRDPPFFEPVDVPEVFAELVAEFRAMVSLEHVALRWDGPEHLVVQTDRRKLRMILKNLVGNALKFTVRGEVVLSCASADGVARFVVRDTGIGIAPQHLPIIFEMFRQVDSSDARSYRGAGLGLHIVQRLVHQLGGEIHVTSEVGRGSTFTFTLPATQPSAGEAPTAERASG